MIIITPKALERDDKRGPIFVPIDWETICKAHDEGCGIIIDLSKAIEEANA